MKILLLVLMIFYMICDSKSYSQIRQDNDLNFSLSTNYEHGFTTDIDDEGEFSVNRYSVNGSFHNDLSERLSIDINGTYSFLDFDFTTTNGFAGLNPWQGINTASMGFRITYDINSQFAITTGPQMKYSGEQGADFSDSLTYSGLAGFA